MGYKYLMGESKVDGATLFSVVASDRTKGNGHKLKICFNKKNSTRTNKPPKNTKKTGKNPKIPTQTPQFEVTFLTVTMTECYYRLSRKIVESLCLKILKTGHSPVQPALASPALSRGIRPDNLQMCLPGLSPSGQWPEKTTPTGSQICWRCSGKIKTIRYVCYSTVKV